MEVVKVSVDEFRYKGESHKQIFGLTHMLQLHLIEFFSKYPQNQIYLITGEPLEIQEAFYGSFDFYQRFGIYYDTLDGSGNIISDKKEYVCMLSDGEDVGKSITAQRKEMNISQFDFYAILYFGDSEDDFVSIIDQLREIDPNANVWNVWQGAKTVHSAEIPGYTLVDVLQIIRDAGVSQINYNNDLHAISECLKQLQGIHCANNEILGLGKGATAHERKLFAYLAAPLVLSGKPVHVDDDYVVHYLSNLRKIFSQNYMLAQDYLEKVANPVSVAVSMQNDTAFVCIRDSKRCPKYVDVQLHVCAVPIDLQTRQISNCSVMESILSYSDIRAYPILELFNITGSFNEQMENSFLLDETISEFESILKQEKGLPGGTINMSNFLIFQYEGQNYAGYVSLIEAEYFYVFIPLSEKYKAFRRSVSLSEYDNFLDIAVFADYKDVLRKLQKYISPGEVHFTCPRGINGSAIMALPPSADRLGDFCGFTFEEIGIWSAQTSQVRLGASQLLLEQFNSEALRAKKFLTFWGGCHPAVTTRLLIDYSVWK